MNKYQFKIEVEAQGPADAELKLKAAATLMKHLKLAEIRKLAEIVEKDPVKTALAKKYLGV